MSTPAQKANLARIRDNQRRSRARRREYLQELEQRLRVYELQGVEASAEVQVAARRVAEENRQLRGLLNRQGISDDYISSYLNSGGAQADPSPVAAFGAGNPGDSVQSLRHIIAPRRPAMIDPGVAYAVVPQDSRETSIASVSTNGSSLWDSAQTTIPSSYARGLPPNVPTPMGRASISAPVPAQSYHPPVFPTTTAPRADSYPAAQPHGALMEDPRQQGYGLATMHPDGHPAMNYTMSMNPYHPGATDPGHTGGC